MIITKEDGIDAVTGEFYHDTFLSDYWYNGVDTNQNNHLVDFSEGETRTVYSGFFVAEDELSDMYLNLFPAYETNKVFDHFEEPDDRNGYFDIRQ